MDSDTELTWHKDENERKKTKTNPIGFMVFRWPLGDSEDLERPSLYIPRLNLTFQRQRGARNPVESQRTKRGGRESYMNLFFKRNLFAKRKMGDFDSI